MKAVLYALFVLFIAGRIFADTSSFDVISGDLPTDVLDKLGDPSGKMQNNNRIIWLYPKGTVEFDNNKVIRVNMMSDSAYAKNQAKRVQQEEAMRQAATAEITAQPAAASNTSIPLPIRRSAAQDASARFYRPFIRPDFKDVQYYQNIPIVFEIAKWPPAMRKDYDVSVEIPVETGQRITTFETLPYELKKYPAEMLEQTLRCIYMIRDIRGNAERMNPAALAFYTEGIVLEHTYMLHHEYAHVLNFLFYDAFPLKQITSISGEYRGFDSKTSLYYTDLWKLGYTSNYAMSSVQEDFAEFCSELYLQPVGFFTAMKENPKLAEKFNVIRPFLEMVKYRTTGDSTPMDEVYFSKFDRNSWKP